MYLLDGADPTGVDGLRRRLDGLGESVALADDGSGTWTVHVHTGDVGAAIEAGLEVGRPHRIDVTRIAEQPTASRAGTPCCWWCPGAELAELARACRRRGAAARAGPAVGVAELVAALAGTGRRQVVLLAGDPGWPSSPNRPPTTARAAGQDVLVMPSGSVLQGLAALAVHDATPPARRRHRGHGRGGGRHPHRVAGGGRGRRR